MLTFDLNAIFFEKMDLHYPFWTPRGPYLDTGGGLGGAKGPQPGEKMGKGIGSAGKKEKGVKKEGGRRKERKNEGDK